MSRNATVAQTRKIKTYRIEFMGTQYELEGYYGRIQSEDELRKVLKREPWRVVSKMSHMFYIYRPVIDLSQTSGIRKHAIGRGVSPKHAGEFIRSYYYSPNRRLE